MFNVLTPIPRSLNSVAFNRLRYVGLCVVEPLLSLHLLGLFLLMLAILALDLSNQLFGLAILRRNMKQTCSFSLSYLYSESKAEPDIRFLAAYQLVLVLRQGLSRLRFLSGHP